jgi:hypothetical protein
LTANRAFIELALRNELKEDLEQNGKDGVIMLVTEGPGSVERDYLDDRDDDAPWSGMESDGDSGYFAYSTETRKADRHYLSRRVRRLLALHEDWGVDQGQYLVEAGYLVGGKEVTVLVMMEPRILISDFEELLKKDNVPDPLCTVTCCITEIGLPPKGREDEG